MKRKDEDMTGKPAADLGRWVNRPMGKVYGPPSWYMDRIEPDDDDDEYRRIQEWKRKTEEAEKLRHSEQQVEEEFVDQLIAPMYGPPEPNLWPNENEDEDIQPSMVDDPIPDVYGPMPPEPPMTTIMPDEDEDDDFPMKGNRPTDSQ